MFDYEDLDFLEDGLQRLDQLKGQMIERHDQARALRHSAGSLRAFSQQLITESKVIRERVKSV